MPTGEKGKSYKENMEYHRGTSWKAKLRVAVDKAIWTSINYEEFLQKMQLAGYEVRQGKHLSFRAPEQKNFTYMKSLGSYYSEENVRIRLSKNRSKAKVPKHLSREARLYINISTYVTTGNREGFERWAKLNNLKEAARTFNYLSENNLLNYEDFKQHVSDIEVSVKVADQKIAQINSELSTQKVIQKHCDSYRLCRKVIEDCKSAKNPKAYRTKHQAEYQLHDSLKKELQDLGVTKIPSSNKIQKQIENLESEQTSTVREKTGITEKAENSGNHSAEFHSTAQCSGDTNSCIRERANSLKRRGTYVTVPLPFPSNLFYCSTLSPLICWWKMYSMWKIELGILSSSIFRSL